MMRYSFVLLSLFFCLSIFSVGVQADQAKESLKKIESYEKGVFAEEAFWPEWCSMTKCPRGVVGVMEMTMTSTSGKMRNVYIMGYMSNTGRVDLCEVIFSNSLFESTTCIE